MGKPNFNTDAFFSAVKRRDMHDLLVIVFNETGFDAAAQVAKDSTRMTDAAVRRIRTALGATLTYADDVKDEKEEVKNELEELIGAIKTAIESGKKKKAKKAFKALKATGVSGSEIDKLKKQIKEMED